MASPETIRSAREAYLGALVQTLNAAAKHAKADKSGDAETALAYAQAAAALMGTDLGKQLTVGKEGLSIS